MQIGRYRPSSNTYVPMQVSFVRRKYCLRLRPSVRPSCDKNQRRWGGRQVGRRPLYIRVAVAVEITWSHFRNILLRGLSWADPGSEKPKSTVFILCLSQLKLVFRHQNEDTCKFVFIFESVLWRYLCKYFRKHSFMLQPLLHQQVSTYTKEQKA